MILIHSFSEKSFYWILLGIAILFLNIWATFLKISGHAEYLKQVLDFRICPIFTMSPNGNSGFIGTDVNSALGSCSLWVAYPTLYGWSVIPGYFLKHQQFLLQTDWSKYRVIRTKTTNPNRQLRLGWTFIFWLMESNKLWTNEEGTNGLTTGFESNDPKGSFDNTGCFHLWGSWSPN